jgi:hypothetical protein
LDDVIVAVPRAAAQPATRAPRVILADAPAWNPATAAGAQWAQIIGRQNRPALRRNGARFIQADTPRITSPALDDFIVPVPKGASGAPATRRGAMPVVADAPPSQQPAPESVIVAVPRAAAAQPVMKAGVAPIIADTPQALQAAFDGLIVSVPRSPAMVPPTRAGASPLVADAPPVALPAMDAQIIRILRATYIAPALIQAWAPVVGQAGATDAILIVVPRVGAIAVRAPGLVLADVLRAPSAGGEAMLIVVPRDAGAVPQIRFLGGLRARRDGTLSARDASLRARNIGE